MLKNTFSKRVILIFTLSVFITVGYFAFASTAEAVVGDWYADMWGIRAFYNQKAIQSGLTQISTNYNNAGAVSNDLVTADKICELAGFNTVVSRSSYEFGTHGRVNFTSCGDNTMGHWNGNNMVVTGACGYTWLASLKCADPITPPTITCSSNSACGTNGYIGSPVCQNGNVYQNYRTYTCNNPGTANSSCSNSATLTLKQNCTGTQTCSSGACVNQNIACSANTDCNDNNPNTQDVCLNPGTPQSVCQNNAISCSSNSACGTNGYIGSPVCQNGNVYQNYITYACNNAGTANSYCTNNTASTLKNTCTGTQICSSGNCVNTECQPGATRKHTCSDGTQVNWCTCNNVGTWQCIISPENQCPTVTCSANTDCGTNDWTGSPFCQNGNVYQNYRTYTCNNAGTANSSCSNSATLTLKQTCTGNQICTNGSCSENDLVVSASANPNPASTGQSVIFSANISGGTGSYTYLWSGACMGTSQTCSKIFTAPGTYNVSLTVVSGIQTRTILTSVVVNSSCITHSYTQCSGTAVYYYDSCGTREDIAQQCSSGQICQNSQCVNENIDCSSNTDCGTNGWIGSPFCQNGNVYQNYRTYTCNNPGTANSSCSNNTLSQVKNYCSGNQTCSNRSCTNQNNLIVSTSVSPNPAQPNQQVVFTATATGGTGNYTYSWSGICSGYSQTCVTTVSNTGTQTATVNVTSGSQNMSSVVYLTVGQNCVQNSYQACSGNYLYWYDSCGNRQNNNYQYCVNGCWNNQCQGQTSGNMTVTKQVRNLTKGTGFSSSVYASPSDVLMFMITLQNSGQTIYNASVTDNMPANLIFNNQMVVACASSGNNYNCNNNIYSGHSGSINSGVNLNTIYNGQTVTISYQVQVAGAYNFSYGSTTLTNNVTVSGNNLNNYPNSNASVVVTRSAVLGASSIATGLTNNFLFDSFLLPLLIALIGIWLWKSGIFFVIEKWFDNKKKINNNYKSEKELENRIASLNKE